MLSQLESSKYNISLSEKIIVIFYNILMLFTNYVNSYFIIVLSALFAIWFLRSKSNLIEGLGLFLAVSIPTSYISILGTSTDKFPLSWFYVIYIVLFIVLFTKKIHLGSFFIVFILMTAYGLGSFYSAYTIIDAFKQYSLLILFVSSYIIAENLFRYTDQSFGEKIKGFYILGVVSYSIVIIIQKISANTLGLITGHYDIIGNNRIVSAGLMNDYSFASLYIASGSILLIVRFMSKQIKFTHFMFIQMFLMYAILSVNSRTGLFALIAVCAIYLLISFLKGNSRILIFVLLFIISIPILLSTMLNNRGGQELLDDSGRFDLLNVALSTFLENPVFGVGLGATKWTMTIYDALPHNMIFQYLGQMGIVGTLIFLSGFIVMFLKYFRYKSEILWSLLVVLVGSMFIPDIVSSRYLTVIVIMYICSSLNNKEAVMGTNIRLKGGNK